jgi:hypothetical protein
MVTLKEHIDILRKLYIPMKKQLVLLVFTIAKDHYRNADNTLIDTSNNETMTLEQFINAIMTSPPPTLPEASNHKEATT